MGGFWFVPKVVRVENRHADELLVTWCAPMPRRNGRDSTRASGACLLLELHRFVEGCPMEADTPRQPLPLALTAPDTPPSPAVMPGGERAESARLGRRFGGDRVDLEAVPGVSAAGILSCAESERVPVLRLRVAL